MPSEDSKPIRKAKFEEVEADDEKAIGSLIRDTKKKPSNSSTKSHLNLKKEEVQNDGLESGLINKPGSRAKGSKTKKEEINDDDDDDDDDEDDDDEDDKPIIKRSSVKIEKVKKKAEKGGNVCKTTKTKQEEIREKKAKKVYDMPGQKRDPPEERDPLRIFYETLHKQLPRSEMAQIWMMESGLLSKEEAKKVFEKKQQKQKLNSPIKATSVTKKEVKSVTLKKKIQSSPVSSDKKTETISIVAVEVTKKRKLGGESSEEDEDYETIASNNNKKKKKKKPRAA